MVLNLVHGRNDCGVFILDQCVSGRSYQLINSQPLIGMSLRYPCWSA